MSNFLDDELRARCQHNPKYSLRAFARDLQVSSSRLSQIIGKKGTVSFSTAQKISRKMAMTALEAKYFQNLALFEGNRSLKMRSNAKANLKKLRQQRSLKVVKSNFQGILSKWYYVPLLEILTLKKRPSNRSISQCLGCSLEELEEAITSLIKAGYLCTKSSAKNISIFKKSNSFIKIESKTSATLIKNFHKRLIGLSTSAIDVQAIESRKYLSTVLTLRKDRVQEARVDLEEFSGKFNAKYAIEEKGDSVYGFNIQFFQLAEEVHGENE